MSTLPGGRLATFSLHTSYTEMPRAFASAFSSAQKLVTNHSRFVAEVALASRVSHMPGTAKSEHRKTRLSMIGSAVMTWLMLHVPATMLSTPSLITPEPNAAASMSNRPPATGVPAASPVRRAASGVTRPAISCPQTGRGSAGNISGMP